MQIMSGKDVSMHIKENIKKEIEGFKSKPKLVDIKIGDDIASDVYITGKMKLANELGIDYETIRFNSNIDEKIIIDKIKELNDDNTVNGIFILSPIPKHYDSIKIMNEVTPIKDVDGLTYINAGKLLNNQEAMVPCTPNGIMEILKYYKIEIHGKNVCIIGRSNLVGKPLVNLFVNKNATVTLCNSHTKNLKEISSKADILVVAIGKKEFITKEFVKENAVVIDVGINKVEGKIYGDVSFEEVKNKTSYITPVPGGVGPMTVTMLLSNVIKSYKTLNNKKTQ